MKHDGGAHDPEAIVAAELGHAMARHRAAVRVGSFVAVACPLVMLGLMWLNPSPYYWVMSAQICLPWVAYVLLGRCGRDEWFVFLAGFLPISCIAMFAYAYVGLLRWAPMLLGACVIGMVMCAAATVRDPEMRRARASLILTACLAAVYSFVALFQLNCALDDSPAVVHESVVTGMVLGIREPCLLRVESWGEDHGVRSAAVPFKLFQAVRKGDKICVVQREGRLGMSWFTLQACPWNRGRVVLGEVGGSR